tara:strand:+ start:512 stop:733 length:222 start_codon:yes stop_codon:yes gene_type:complete
MSIDPLHPSTISEEIEWNESDDFLNVLCDSVRAADTKTSSPIQFTPIRKSLELEQIATRWMTEWIEAAKKESR